MREASLDPNEGAAVEQLEAAGAAAGKPGEAPLGKMKIDLHCHSEASIDCITPLGDIPSRCAERGIAVQAITDHNEIWGAQTLKAMAEESGSGLTVIVGEEITTLEGELIGLFLSAKIEAGLSPEETVKRIKAQGGLVYLPHGFDPMKRSRLRPGALTRIASEIDIVETFNARISQPRWNRAAVRWAQSRELPISAGSDAHTRQDIGSAWVEVPARAVGSPQDLLLALEGGTPVGEWTHPALAVALKFWDDTRRRWRSRRDKS
ncbi:MAG: PHP domain-containing protein [Deinococcota bacterium]|nr:PHP domain-containing protein [Deinococcota bacterium]